MKQFEYPSDDNPEARAAEFRTSVLHQFRAGNERMTRLESSLEHCTRATDKNTARLDIVCERNEEMFEVFNAMKGGFVVLGWLGRLAKWGTAIAAGGGLLYKLVWPESPK